MTKQLTLIENDYDPFWDETGEIDEYETESDLKWLVSEGYKWFPRNSKEFKEMDESKTMTFKKYCQIMARKFDVSFDFWTEKVIRVKFVKGGKNDNF